MKLIHYLTVRIRRDFAAVGFLIAFAVSMQGRVYAGDFSVTTEIGKVNFDEKGKWTLHDQKGEITSSASLCYYARKWSLKGQDKLAITRSPEKGSSLPWVWSGSFNEGESTCEFTQTVQLSNGKLNLKYDFKPGAGFKVEPKSKAPLLRISLAKSVFEDKTIKLGAKPVQLPAHNKWGYGNRLLLSSIGSELSWDQKSSISVWKSPQPEYLVRVFMKGKKPEGDGLLTDNYSLNFTMGKFDPSAKKKSVSAKKVKRYDYSYLKLESKDSQMSFAKSGAWIVNRNQVSFNGEMAVLMKGWRKINQGTFKLESSPEPDSALPWVWKGVFISGDKQCNMTQTVSIKDGLFHVLYELDIDKGFVIEKRAKFPFLDLHLPQSFEKSAVKLGHSAMRLPAHNAWGSGQSVLLPKALTELKMSPSIMQSLWRQRDGGWSIRAYCKGNAANSNGEIAGKYYLNMTIVPSTKKIAASETLSLEERIADRVKGYRRILMKPGPEGVSYKLGHALLDQAIAYLKSGDVKNARNKEKKFTDWAALQSQAYDLSDQVIHLKLFSKHTGYKINPAIIDGYKKVCDALTDETQIVNGKTLAKETNNLLYKAEAETLESYNSSYWPNRKYTPRTWVKAFADVGYTRSKDNLMRQEPSPWGVNYKNQNSFSLIAKDTPITGYNSIRSWVSTAWKGPQGKFTFSMLTPLVLCDDINELRLSDLSSEIDSVSFIDETSALKTVALNEIEAIKSMTKNYIWLKGKKLSLLVFLGGVPSGIKSESKLLSMKFAKESHASILSLPQVWEKEMVLKEANLWSGVSVRPPSEVVLTYNNDSVTYNYLYKENRSDAWNTKPLSIAMIPHLTVLAEGSEKYNASKISTSYGYYCYMPGEKITLQNPSKTIISPLKGINAHLSKLTDEYVKELSDQRCEWIRIVIGTGWNKDVENCYIALDDALGVLRKHNIKALIDPHDFTFKVNRKDGIPESGPKKEAFLELWRRLTDISIKHLDVVIGYDLYNELHVFKLHAWPQWYALAEEAIKVIRAKDTKTPIYLSAVDMSNPSGYLKSKEYKGESNLIYSFHFYAPHSFTHQKHNHGSTDPDVFYPGWVPVIQWGPWKLYGPQPMVWFDRWTLGAAMLPVLKFEAKYNVNFHCGEVAPIGYAGGRTAESARFWTRDSLDWLESNKFSWNLWNEGYGMCIPEVKELVLKRWSK